MKSFQIFFFKYLVRVSSRPELGFLGRIIRRKKFIKKKIKPGQQIEVRGEGERCLGTAAFILVTFFAFTVIALTLGGLRGCGELAWWCWW